MLMKDNSSVSYQMYCLGHFLCIIIKKCSTCTHDNDFMSCSRTRENALYCTVLQPAAFH